MKDSLSSMLRLQVVFGRRSRDVQLEPLHELCSLKSCLTRLFRRACSPVIIACVQPEKSNTSRLDSSFADALKTTFFRHPTKRSVAFIPLIMFLRESGTPATKNISMPSKLDESRLSIVCDFRPPLLLMPLVSVTLEDMPRSSTVTST